MQREIWHEIHINSPQRRVYELLTEPSQLAGWWTTDVRGASIVGKSLEFRFNGRLAAEMHVTGLQPDRLVQWQASERSHPQWVGTELSFELFPVDVRRTNLHLRHSKWRHDAAMFPECSMHWAIYLLSLKEFAETGRGRPHPHDLPVNLPIVAGQASYECLRQAEAP